MVRKKKIEQAIIIPDEEYITREDFEAYLKAGKKNGNPVLQMYGLLLVFGVLIIGGMLGMYFISRPTETPIPIAYPTQIADTPIPTATKTPTATWTPDRTATFIADPRWGVIERYIDRVMAGDYGGAWNLLTSRCQYRECWESWFGDFQAFKDWWWALGKVEIRSIVHESMSEYNAQAFVVLYFKKDEQPHNYRFYIVYDSGEWKIGRIEWVALIK